MTNFEKLTASPRVLGELLERVQDDALAAEGCSLKLKLPDAEICITWEEWLRMECDNDGC